MHLQERIELMVELGRYMSSDDKSWQTTKEQATAANGWFIPEFIEMAVQNIVSQFLDENNLKTWVGQYSIPDQKTEPKNVGLVLAGNIPLVGFHDLLSVFISGHRQTIKPSSRDRVLIEHIVKYLESIDKRITGSISFTELPKGSDAYLATGSNQSARYFEYYFSKYPHVIRRNRTSIAILLGNESMADLEKLAQDVFCYFGLGCRNVTKVLVPRNYDFVPLLDAFRKFDWLIQNHKYKNNYDYQLTLLLLNKKYYMTNGSVLLVENPSPFSSIGTLHYEHYDDATALPPIVLSQPDIQCVVGKDGIPFGETQKPGLTDYPDGVDILEFLTGL